MDHVHWEDRLSEADYAKAELAMSKFKNSRKTRQDGHIAYDELTQAGMTSEEADEMVNLLTDGG